MAKKILKKKKTVKKETQGETPEETLKDEAIINGGYDPKEDEDIAIQPNIITEE